VYSAERTDSKTRPTINRTIQTATTRNPHAVFGDARPKLSIASYRDETSDFMTVADALTVQPEIVRRIDPYRVYSQNRIIEQQSFD